MLARTMPSPDLRAPFPWFGGKSRAASLIWERFGEPTNYVEPFAGSLAVLLARPSDPKIETVNDLDCYLANVWRAIAWAPDEVAYWADWPVNEADLHARHRWLVDRVEFRQKVRSDPEYFDAKVAGWWIWGVCAWIGSGWCDTSRTVTDGAPARAKAFRDVPDQLPHIGAGGTGSSTTYGRGVHGKAMRNPPAKIPLLGGTKGTGVHRRGVLPDPSQELPEQLPHLPGGAAATDPAANYGKGIHGKGARSAILDTMQALAVRLRGVRVACGDFERILSDSITWRHGSTAVLLDPPYADGEDVYAEGGRSIFARAAAWAEEHGKDERLRICLCGYESTWAPPAGWSTVPWKAKGGYGSQRKDGANENSKRERLWFSPACLTRAQGSLF
jgi:hypothetical protein